MSRERLSPYDKLPSDYPCVCGRSRGVHEVRYPHPFRDYSLDSRVLSDCDRFRPDAEAANRPRPTERDYQNMLTFATGGYLGRGAHVRLGKLGWIEYNPRGGSYTTDEGREIVARLRDKARK